MMSEVFPLAMGTASVMNLRTNFPVVLTFPIALSAVMGVVCLLGLIFSIRYEPETKGLALEEIERRLKAGSLLKPAA